MSVIDDDGLRPAERFGRFVHLGPAMLKTASLMSPVEALAERADDLGRQALRLRALSRTRPHAFLEDKEELARAVFKLAEDIRQIGRRSERSSAFHPCPVLVGDRSIPVETRRKRRT